MFFFIRFSINNANFFVIDKVSSLNCFKLKDNKTENKSKN